MQPRRAAAAQLPVTALARGRGPWSMLRRWPLSLLARRATFALPASQTRDSAADTAASATKASPPKKSDSRTPRSRPRCARVLKRRRPAHRRRTCLHPPAETLSRSAPRSPAPSTRRQFRCDRGARGRGGLATAFSPAPAASQAPRRATARNRCGWRWARRRAAEAGRGSAQRAAPLTQSASPAGARRGAASVGRYESYV